VKTVVTAQHTHCSAQKKGRRIIQSGHLAAVEGEKGGRPTCRQLLEAKAKYVNFLSEAKACSRLSPSPSILFRAETNYCEWMHPVSSNFVISSKRATSIIIEADLALLILSSNSLTIAPEEKEACVLIDRRSREA
jgi:hypothetical protein